MSEKRNIANFRNDYLTDNRLDWEGSKENSQRWRTWGTIKLLAPVDGNLFNY